MKGKIEKVMHEFKEGKLHSGSKKGPEVKSRKQAIAIALSEANKGSSGMNRSRPTTSSFMKKRSGMSEYGHLRGDYSKTK